MKIGKPGYASWWYKKLIDLTGERFKVQLPQLFVTAMSKTPSSIPGQSAAFQHASDSRLQRILESGSGHAPPPSEAAQTDSTADAWRVATATVAQTSVRTATTIAAMVPTKDDFGSPYDQPEVANSTPWAAFVGLFTAGMACGGVIVYAGVSVWMPNRLQSLQRVTDAGSVDATPYRAILET